MILGWLRRIAEQERYLRPPGAISEAAFEHLCIRCRKCIEICPYHSIKPAGGESFLQMGTPYIVPREQPCYLCMKCPPICPTGALTPITRKEEVRMGVAKINKKTCLAYNGILCRACYERCPLYREAITLEGEILPVVHEDKCVGCGICENVCLTDPASIVVIPAER